MEEKKLLNVSSSPHVRSRLKTGIVMRDVIIALMPAAIMGVCFQGIAALLTILTSVISAVLTEWIFDYIVKKKNTVKDGSAVVTGLLLALVLPGDLPLFVPMLGAVFAILFVKCLFGGLGKNFMNPALAGRCFLLISFSGIVTTYKVDGISTATPLVDLAEGRSVDLVSMLAGSASGVIGSSALALLLGGIFLLAVRGITWEIPVTTLLSFALFIGVFGGQGFDPIFIITHLCGGGILMAAFFMATDPVTSPVTSSGQLVFGCVVGILSGLFRVFGSSADSVSYAVILSNLLVPFIDQFCVPKPFGYRTQKKEGQKTRIPKSAVILTVITLLAGLCLSGVYTITKERIEEQELAANAASYQEVVPEAVEFTSDKTIDEAVEALDGGIYGTDFGKVYIQQVIVGKDEAGEVAGYILRVTSGDAFDGTITMSVGLQPDGTVNGISFTEIHETAGMGMLCQEDAFKNQFCNKKVEQFVLNKAGGSAAEEEIDSVSGASVSSGAVVNAVNAALDFFAANIG